MADRLRARSGRRAARRGGRDRDRTQDRAATSDRDDPRGRVALQRRDRAGRPAHGARRPASSATSAAGTSAGTSCGAAGGGVLVGLSAFMLVGWLRKRINDPVLDVGLSFVIPFACFLAAEEIHASGVVAVVVAGLLLGHKAPILQTAQSRIAERINWRTIAFLLENTVFALIGLQAQWLFQDLADSQMSAGRIVAVCLMTLVAVIVLRMVWVFVGPLRAGAAHQRRRHPSRPPWLLHVPARLGRHARGRHARGRLPDPQGHRRTARCCFADRLHRGGGHAADPGADAAVVRPGAQGPVAGPARRRPGARDAPPAGVQGGARRSSTRSSTTTRPVSAT